MSPHDLPTKPLERIVHVRDGDEGRSLLTRLYGQVHADFQVGNSSRFAWHIESAMLGPFTIVKGDVGVGIHVTGKDGPYYVLGTVSQGGSRISSMGSQFVLAADDTAFLASPGVQICVDTVENTRTLNLTIDAQAVASHLLALTGAAVKELPRFAPCVDLHRAAGAHIVQLGNLLRAATVSLDSPLTSPHVFAHLREMVLGALLLGLESSISPLLRRPTLHAGARVVRQAEQYISAHASEPVSIAALAQLTGVSLRSLERSFKTVHGCSIRTFLMQRRLELARQRLIAAVPGTSVTQILYASGFGHAGEFSKSYHQQFGERPSETLQRALRR